MKELYGIILVDGSEIILRIYQTENNQWQMIYTSKQDLVEKKREKLLTAYDIAEAIADLFSTTYTQKVIEWRICARFQTQEMIGAITKATGLRVEYLDRTREQELLSKGMFTEFW